MKLFLLV